MFGKYTFQALDGKMIRAANDGNIHEMIALLKRYSRSMQIPMLAFSTGTIDDPDNEGKHLGNRIMIFMSPRESYPPMHYLWMLASMFADNYDVVMSGGTSHIFLCFPEPSPVGPHLSWFSGTRQNDFAMQVSNVPTPLYHAPELLAGEIAFKDSKRPLTRAEEAEQRASGISTPSASKSS